MICVCANVCACYVVDGVWVVCRTCARARLCVCEQSLIAKSLFSASFEKAGGCPTPEEWASNKEALQSVLIWFWDARTTYPQNVKNASYSSERVSKCVPDRHSVKGPGVDA